MMPSKLRQNEVSKSNDFVLGFCRFKFVTSGKTNLEVSFELSLRTRLAVFNKMPMIIMTIMIAIYVRECFCFFIMHNPESPRFVHASLVFYQ